MDFSHHPCFSGNARHAFGRIHLPVAPRCNMQCNYCNRDFDCVNEARPGVTRAVLKPRQAADYLDAVLMKINNIAVTGIAGPGDPFANAEETLETLRRVRERHPDMILCVASNGLAVSEYVEELCRLSLSHVTITVNAVDPEIGRWIYAWARLESRMHRGLDAARLILENQREAIRRLKEKDITVKINTVVIPGVNDDHVTEIAEEMAKMKADVMNCIPIYHVANTPFADIQPPSPARIAAIREAAGVHLPQMGHCQRCRADAAGLLGQPQSDEILELLHRAAEPRDAAGRAYVAAASMEGLFVNQHVGETSQFWIYGLADGKAELVDRRSAPAAGGGSERWQEMARRLHDCSTILASGIGPAPQKILEAAGFRVIIMEGMVAEGVEAALTGRDVPKILLRTPGKCGFGQQCMGDGTGCG